MLLLGLTFRHLRRHWRLNLAVLLGLTLAVALLASLPSYATAIAARSLRRNLDDASPAVRNLLVTGNRATFSAGLFGRFEELLGDLVESRMEVRHGVVAADPVTPTQQIDGKGRILVAFHVFSFDKLPSSTRVVKGRLPDPVKLSDASNFLLKPPPVEVVIGARAAERSGYGVGDRLTSHKGFLKLDVVGIVEPLDPQNDIWGDDLSAFDTRVDEGTNFDQITLSLIASTTSVKALFTHDVFWRVTLDHARITPDNAENILAELINFQAQLSANRATVSTGLVQILEAYLSHLSQVQMSLLLLTVQAFIFVLYTLALLTSFMLDRSQIELATLSGRGATALQITGAFALENLLLALPAGLLLGPGLAQAGMQLWAALTGESVPAALPGEAWVLAGVAVGLGWLALVVPIYPAARRNLLEWQQTQARPARLSLLQKSYLDVFLLAFGALLYWQLNQSGSIVMRRLGHSSLADPLLLLGPSLLLIAVALVFLRIFPYLLRLAAWAFQRARGLMLPLGLSRLARDPLKASRVVLLISLAASLILLSRSFDDSLAYSQDEMAHYLAGADLRISLDPPAGQTDPPANVPLADLSLANLSGVRVASPVFRAIVQTDEGRAVNVIAVDPATLDQVARYPPGLTSLTMPSLMRILQSGAQDDAFPAILSYSALPTKATVGDRVTLTFLGRRLHFVVRGIIRNFPTASGDYVVISLPDLEQQLDLDALRSRLHESFELWLDVDPAQHDALMAHTLLKDRVLDDAQTHLHRLQNDPLAQGTEGAFQLSALTLALLSVATFLLVHFFAAQGRVIEFSVLRSMGLSVRQLSSLLATEGVLVMVLGLVAGTAIGYGLAQVMLPFLSRALTAALAGVLIQRVMVDWPALARWYALLIGFYALAMGWLLLALNRVGIHRAMRMGDE